MPLPQLKQYFFGINLFYFLKLLFSSYEAQYKIKIIAEALLKHETLENVMTRKLFEQPATDVINCPYCDDKIKVSKE